MHLKAVGQDKVMCNTKQIKNIFFLQFGRHLGQGATRQTYTSKKWREKTKPKPPTLGETQKSFMM